MKKAMASMLACTLLIPVYFNGLSSPVSAQTEDEASLKKSVEEETNY